MPITALALENFRAFSTPTRFELRPITLLVGPNNSGKSSVTKGLRAVQALAELFKSGQSPHQLNETYSTISAQHNRRMGGSMTGLGVKLGNGWTVRIRLLESERCEHPEILSRLFYKGKYAAALRNGEGMIVGKWFSNFPELDPERKDQWMSPQVFGLDLNLKSPAFQGGESISQGSGDLSPLESGSGSPDTTWMAEWWKNRSFPFAPVEHLRALLDQWDFVPQSRQEDLSHTVNGEGVQVRLLDREREFPDAARGAQVRQAILKVLEVVEEFSQTLGASDLASAMTRPFRVPEVQTRSSDNPLSRAVWNFVDENLNHGLAGDYREWNILSNSSGERFGALGEEVIRHLKASGIANSLEFRPLQNNVMSLHVGRGEWEFENPHELEERRLLGEIQAHAALHPGAGPVNRVGRWYGVFEEEEEPELENVFPGSWEDHEAQRRAALSPEAAKEDERLRREHHRVGHALWKRMQEAKAAAKKYHAEQDRFRPADGVLPVSELGYGSARMLTLILGLATKKASGGVVVLEEPEVHLHPNLQSRLADLFVDAAHRGQRLLVETHSEYLIRKLQYLVATGKADPKDIVIYYLGPDPTAEDHVREITLDERGALSQPFGPGFYDEATTLMADLFRFQARN